MLREMRSSHENCSPSLVRHQDGDPRDGVDLVAAQHVELEQDGGLAGGSLERVILRREGRFTNTL